MTKTTKQEPIRTGSRWLSNVDRKTVLVVIENKSFDRFETKVEGRMSFSSTYGRCLRASFTRLEGCSADADFMREVLA